MLYSWIVKSWLLTLFQFGVKLVPLPQAGLVYYTSKCSHISGNIASSPTIGSTHPNCFAIEQKDPPHPTPADLSYGTRWKGLDPLFLQTLLKEDNVVRCILSSTPTQLWPRMVKWRGKIKIGRQWSLSEEELMDEVTGRGSQNHGSHSAAGPCFIFLSHKAFNQLPVSPTHPQSKMPMTLNRSVTKPSRGWHLDLRALFHTAFTSTALLQSKMQYDMNA